MGLQDAEIPAEVYAKDVGIIADVTGLMVVAGGSAGFNPRIADIIAKDLNEKQALIVIDSIFEYYKENAELGEKLGFMIDRIGIEKFRKDIIEKANLN